MSANNQVLVKEYKGKWYVFKNVMAESWCELDENDNIIEGRDNELKLSSATKSFDTEGEALIFAQKLGWDTEYGVHEYLAKDGADVKIIE